VARVVHGRFRFQLHLPATGSSGRLELRAWLVRGKRRVAVSAVHSLLEQFAAAKPGPPPRAQTPVQSVTQPTVVVPPPSVNPIVVTTPGVTVAVGAAVDVSVPAPVTSLTSIESASGGSGVSASLQSGALSISAAIAASPGSAQVSVHAVGCSASGCGERIQVEVPVTVRGLAAPAGVVESVTEPSPERAAQAVDHHLLDELVITVGTADEPGTRQQAEAAAASVEGVISGGIEGSGIYQVRWETPQNLATRRAELEAVSDVTSVSDATVGDYETTGVYPVAPQFELGEFTWPYLQIHALEAWSQATGSNVTVGVIDEADVYRAHEDLNVTGTIGPYVPPLASAASDPAHASHVAGLACARNNVAEGAPTQLGMVGVAWGCPIVSAATRNISSDTMLNLMTEMARLHAVRVVNISLGHNVAPHSEHGTLTKCANQTDDEEIEEEDQVAAPQFETFLAGPEGRKIVWVTSAGNDCAPIVANAWGLAGGSLRNVITVAATNSDETLANFSDYGPAVKVAAPGGFAINSSGTATQTTGLMSSVPGVLDCPFSGYCPAYICLQSECSEYEQMAGTSMASPIVAGTAALVASKNPGFSAEEVGACVTGSAGAAGSPGVDDYTLGRSDLQPPGYIYNPVMPAGADLPIVDAAAAVECKHRHTSASFRGSGGGDGWAVALSSSDVFNVFHHSDSLTVACHGEATAEPCWSPKTLTDSFGNGYATSGQPGLQLNEATGKLYVFATRTSDDTAGVVCINTTEAENPDPFCGFTELTGANEATVDGRSAVSNGALVGSRWYAFNYVSGSGSEGARNKLLCFDVTTDSACPGQPFALPVGDGVDENGDYPPPAVVAIGSKVIVPLDYSEAPEELACFDGNAEAACGGDWPVDLEGGYASYYGGAYPLLTAAGGTIGLCLPTGADPCYGLAGESVATPENMSSAMPATSGWNGPALTIGSRVYVPNGESDSIECYDYRTSSGCEDYPLFLSGLGLLYTVNRDPERPDCIWVNSDNGEAQIQNFEASNGSGTCK
jgi:subtilisin family serine protease